MFLTTATDPIFRLHHSLHTFLTVEGVTHIRGVGYVAHIFTECTEDILHFILIDEEFEVEPLDFLPISIFMEFGGGVEGGVQFLVQGRRCGACHDLMGEKR
jgi:hypothetical protein